MKWKMILKQISLRAVKIYFNTIVITVVLSILAMLFLLYGPLTGFRDYYITSAMTTLNHKWLATMLYPEKLIIAVMASNVVIESGESTNENLIKNDESKYSHLPDSDPLKPVGDEKYKMIKITGNDYYGFLVAIYDTKNIKMGVSKNIGDFGERLSIASKRDNALVAMNANGFIDVGGHGNGGVPTGLIINDGKLVFTDNPSEKHSVIAFSESGNLILTKATPDEAVKAGFKMAAEFGPFLIVNGVPAITKGNGGWGQAGRTAIGQRKDGIVLFLVTDGRQALYKGATLVDIMNIMVEYGAYNAANLDGGSSSVMAIDGEIINKPSSSGGERYVPNWFMLVP